MKRFMTLMLFIGIALTSLAQKNVDEIIDQYSRDKEVQYIHLPRLLIQAGVAQMKTSKTTDVARNINDLRILLLDNCRNGKRKKFRKKVERLTQNGYQEFAKMKDADDDILFIAQGNTEKISEIAALVTGKEGCKFLQIKGNFNTKDINAVVDDVLNM